MALPYLTSDFSGIGGSIKNRVEDFFVQEIPLYEPCGEGEHWYIEIQKIGITTFEAMHRLAKALHVREKDIGYAGLKDARAITRQTFSVAGVSEDAITAAFLPDMVVQMATRHRNKLRIGHLAGNRFAVKVRDIRPTDVVRLRPVLNVLEKRGLPNYFGEQRFGRRGDNHLLGAALIADDPAKVLHHLLGGDEQDEARRAFDAGEYETAIKAYPRDHGLERRVLSRLIKTGKPAAAVGAVDEKIRRLWVSALQSTIFNDVVAKRIASLDRLMDGDLAYIHQNGACFHVDAAATEQPRADAFEISPTGPMIGGRMDSPTGEPATIEADAIREAGISAEQINAGRRGWLHGARRPMRVRPTNITLEAGVDDHGAFITVAFTLPAGSYATVLLRELMKRDSLERPRVPGGDEGANAEEDEDGAEDGHQAQA